MLAEWDVNAAIDAGRLAQMAYYRRFTIVAGFALLEYHELVSYDSAHLHIQLDESVGSVWVHIPREALIRPLSDYILQQGVGKRGIIQIAAEELKRYNLV